MRKACACAFVYTESSLMDAVWKHLNGVLELLAVSQTDCVREWDHHATVRAFQWAEYCERLHSRFHSNPTSRAALESELNDANRRLQETVPSYSPVMFSELAQCQHKLLVYLLRNPFAPQSVLQMLFTDPQNTANEVQLDQSSIFTCKSAFKLLCCTQDGTGYAGLATEPVVRGELLSKRLNSVLTRCGNEEYAGTLLDSVLLDSAGKIQRLYDVIASALLSGDDETNAFILAWLRNQDGGLGELCRSLSPELCNILSRESSEFKRAYWCVLKRWASLLVYDVTESVWVTSEETVTFNGLAERIKELLKSGSQLKEETEAELKELKLEDGDFNVKGLSIWTDLIIQLKI